MQNSTENFSITPEIQARFDHKRFPKIWLALLGVALIHFTGSAVLTFFNSILGQDYCSFFQTSFTSSMFNLLVSQFFSLLIIPLTLAFACKLDFFATFRIKRKLDFKQIILLVIISLGFFLISQLVNSFFVGSLASVLGQPSETPVSFKTETLPQLFFAIVITSFLPAICEEFFFRGFVMRSFERISPTFAVIISAFIFALMHGTFQQFLCAFIVGLLLGYVALITDSIWASAIMHCVLNTISVLLSHGVIEDLFIKIQIEMPIVFLSIAFISAIVGALALVLFKNVTVKKNIEKYSRSYVSELEYPRLMPKQTALENIISVIASVIFVAINVLNMFFVWYYDFFASL